MTQRERREYLINYLLNENSQYKDIELPQTDDEQKYLFRSLVNVRPPVPASQIILALIIAFTPLRESSFALCVRTSCKNRDTRNRLGRRKSQLTQ